MKIAVYCGSFNPPHIGHYQLATHLLASHYADKVIVVPTGDAYPKQALAPAEYRLEMVQTMFANEPNILIDDFELKNQLVYTFHTIQHVQTLFPNDEISLVLGADNYQQVSTWDYYEELKCICQFLVIKREGYPTPTPIPQTKTTIIDLHIADISSTSIRQALAQNDPSFCKFIQAPVYAYIQKNHLYKNVNKRKK